MVRRVRPLEASGCESDADPEEGSESGEGGGAEADEEEDDDDEEEETGSEGSEEASEASLRDGQATDLPRGANPSAGAPGRSFQPQGRRESFCSFVRFAFSNLAVARKEYSGAVCRHRSPCQPTFFDQVLTQPYFLWYFWKRSMDRPCFPSQGGGGRTRAPQSGGPAHLGRTGRRGGIKDPGRLSLSEGSIHFSLPKREPSKPPPSARPSSGWERTNPLPSPPLICAR